MFGRRSVKIKRDRRSLASGVNTGNVRVMLTLVRQFWETIFFNLWLKPNHIKRDGFEPFVWPFQRCCEEEIVHRTSVIRRHGCLTSGIVDGGSS